MIIFLLFVLYYFGAPSTAVDVTRYKYTVESLAVAEYEKIPRTDSTNLAGDMDIFICDVKRQSCSFNITYLTDSNSIKHKQDEETDSGCTPLDNGCYLITENYNGSRNIDIILCTYITSTVRQSRPKELFIEFM